MTHQRAAAISGEFMADFHRDLTIESCSLSGRAPDVLEAHEAIALLADKWRSGILQLLRDGALRTHELQRSLGGISPKMLTQTLRGMERDGLVNRVVYPVAPPHVEYKLTQMGVGALKPLQDLCAWANRHRQERDVRFADTAALPVDRDSPAAMSAG